MTLKGSYKNNVAYSVGDVVMYTDNVVYHLQKPAKAGTPCTNTLYWERYDLVETVKLILDAISISGDNVTSKVANNLTTTASGKILDARQGKALKDTFDKLNPDNKTLVLYSSTSESTKKFGITVDDSGELTATEITEGSGT